MRTIFTFFTLWITCLLWAQQSPIYSEDFEGDLSNWLIEDVDGDGDNWGIVTSSDQAEG